MNPVGRFVHPGGPTEDALFEFIAGRMHPQAAEWLADHVRSCGRCGAVVTRVGAVRELLEPPPEAPFRRQAAVSAVRRRLERPVSRGRWSAFAVAALAAAALGIGLRARHPLVALVTPIAHGEPIAWSIVAREGVADLQVGDEHTLVQSRMLLPVGGVLSVQPGSRVVARWGGARVVIDGGAAGAQLRLVSSRVDERSVQLERGRVLLDVDPLGRNTLAVLSDGERVTVHGTRFFVERADGGTAVAVERGRVRVASRSRTVDVDGGGRLSPGSARPSALESDDLHAFAASAPALALPNAVESETLDVFADVPVAEVSVDGVAHGRAPLSLALVTGAHEVRVTADGRLPFLQRVMVVAGSPLLLHAELARVALPVVESAEIHRSRAATAVRPGDLLVEARADLLAGNYGRAIGRLEPLQHRVGLDPTEAARAALLEAQAYRLERRAEPALPLLERAARGDGPEAEQGQMLLAQTLGRDLADPGRAAGAWAESLRHFPHGIFHEEAAYRLGESLLTAGQTLDGLAAIDRYLEAFPRGMHVDDAHLAAAAARRDRLGDCAGALGHLRAVASGRGPRAELALVAEARCLKTVGRSDEAHAAYSAYLASAPNGRFADEARANVSARAERQR